MFAPERAAAAGIAVVAVELLAGSIRADQAPSFDLPRRVTGERVRLEHFAGQVLVLDFFAYWCAPCERASKELEIGVQQFYTARNGNPQGVPVRVVSVNIEKDLPERTEEFLRRTGASFAVDDPEAALLQEFGNPSIPFLVVLDGSRSRPGEPRFEIVYRHAGFEGTRKLRRVIDGLGRPTGSASSLQVVGPETRGDRVAGAPILHTVQMESEVAWASDILLTESKLTYRQERGGTEWDVSFSYASFLEDYRPYVPFGVDLSQFREQLYEDRYSGQLNFRQRVAEPLTLLGSTGGFYGYPDYRRVWIANRYRQKYGHLEFTGEPDYEEPNPKGFNVSLGSRWEYLPATGFAELKLGYGREQTAPGYADSLNDAGEFLLIQGRERLDIKTLSVSSENVLSRRVRALNEFTLTHTTARELRYSYQASLNVAVGERWVTRGNAGFTTEAPQFDAYFVGATIEYEAWPNLFLGLTGRYYKDTGEIENSLVGSSAAPPLQSWEAGLSLRYAGRRASVKLYAGPFWTDYEPITAGSPDFTYLYADRNWGLAQIAFVLHF